MNFAIELNDFLDLIIHNSDKLGFKIFDRKEDFKSIRKINVNFTTSVPGMNAISHQIEEEAATFSSPFRFYSDFQRFSRVKPQAKRYIKILETQNPLYIFGVPDVVLWKAPNLIEVPLEEPLIPDYPYLAKNWFVLLYSPDFTSMALVGREITDPFSSLQLQNRRFEGFWTYDAAVVSQVVSLLDGYIASTVGVGSGQTTDAIPNKFSPLQAAGY